MKRRERYEPGAGSLNRPIIDGRTYTRASTLAKALDDQSALIDWSARSRCRACPVSLTCWRWRQPRRWMTVRRGRTLPSGRRKPAGATSGRDTGTSIHAATEAIEWGGRVAPAC